MNLEGTLVEKLRKLEALHAGTTVDGEREAARRAAERIRARLAELRGREKDEVRVYSLPDPWTRQLFLALCRRYGLKPYRERGQRYSTVQVPTVDGGSRALDRAASSAASRRGPLRCPPAPKTDGARRRSGPIRGVQSNPDGSGNAC